MTTEKAWRAHFQRVDPLDTAPDSFWRELYDVPTRFDAGRLADAFPDRWGRLLRLGMHNANAVLMAADAAGRSVVRFDVATDWERAVVWETCRRILILGWEVEVDVEVLALQDSLGWSANIITSGRLNAET